MSEPPTPSDIDALLDQCDSLVDQSTVLETRIKFMNRAVDSYDRATALLGYFSRLQNFSSELAQLNDKLTKHRQKLLETYIDLLPQETIKSLSMPSTHTKQYQRGSNRFDRVRNYIIYHYRQKLYLELEAEHRQINNIRGIVSTIARLDKHYDIYEELIIDLQKKHRGFDQIMTRHLNEFVYI